MMHRRNIVITIVCLIVMMPGISFAAAVGEESPTFEVQTIEGVDIRSDELKDNNSVLLIFWATWCPVCKEEIPKVNTIYETFHPQGLEVIAIDVGINDSLKRVKRYVKKYGLSYPVVFDEGSSVTKQFGVQGTPTIFIIDKRGIVRYRSAAIPDDLAEHFDALMQ